MTAEQILQDYYKESGKKLYGIVDKMLSKFGGVYDMDRADFYSIANEVMVDVSKNYDNSKRLESYVHACLLNKIKTEFTRRNREKRKADRLTVSLDLPVGEDDELTIGDTLASEFDTEKEVLSGHALGEGESGERGGRAEAYLNGLPQKTRRIMELKMQGVPAREIKARLGMTEKEYSGYCRQAKEFRYLCVLLGGDDNIRAGDVTEKAEEMNNGREETGQRREDSAEREEVMEMCTQTLEKSKPGRLNIAAIIKKIDNYTIRFDHPLQRESEQWSTVMKGNLISDILQGNPIPALVFAEQIVNGLAVIWDLDGKQRCTNAYAFFKGGYKISKNIRRWNIIYQEQVRDKNGKPVLDKEGFPKSKRVEFDIRGKKFSDLPEELQDKFLEYNFEIVQYLNCSGDDIAYHIARYNEGKPMTPSQKGLTRLGEEFAGAVKSISNMDFFKNLGGYKISEANNGTINRVVVESVMASRFLESWKKKQEDMCAYIKENASIEDFERFEEAVERITKVGTEETFAMFDSKDSFIWFGLFAGFSERRTEDEKFIAFMKEFKENLHDRKINGISFDELSGKATKDKAVVISKIKHLEQLLDEFLRQRAA